MSSQPPPQMSNTSSAQPPLVERPEALPTCFDDFTGTLVATSDAITDKITAIVLHLWNVPCIVEPVRAPTSHNLLFRIRLSGQISTNSELPLRTVFRMSKDHKKLHSLFDFTSEIHAMLYLRVRNVPVPKVYAYCTNGRLFGLQFMIMRDYSPVAVPLNIAFPFMNEAARSRFIAEYAECLLKIASFGTRRGIGAMRGVPSSTAGLFSTINLYGMSGPQAWAPINKVSGPQHITRQRRPLRNLEEWIDLEMGYRETWLDWARQDPNTIAHSSTADKEDRLNTEKMLARLRPLAKLASRHDPTPNMSILVHGALYASDIMVIHDGHAAGKIVAILDWEGSNFVPVWMGYGLPLGIPAPPEKVQEMQQTLIRYIRAKNSGLLVSATSIEGGMLYELMLTIKSNHQAGIARWIEKWENILKAQKTSGPLTLPPVPEPSMQPSASARQSAHSGASANGSTESGTRRNPPRAARPGQGSLTDSEGLSRNRRRRGI